MLALLEWIVSPIGKVVGSVLAILAVIGFIYGKGRVDSHRAFKEKIQRESTKAVAKANAARDRATVQFDTGRMRNDGFNRD